MRISGIGISSAEALSEKRFLCFMKLWDVNPGKLAQHYSPLDPESQPMPPV